MLETRRMLIEAQTTEARTLAEQHSMLADLSLHCGIYLFERTLSPALIHKRSVAEVTMKFKTIFLLLIVAAAAGGIGWFAAHHSARDKSPAPSHERKILYYQSPMHPWITSDKPGRCTICGMKLEPV